MRTRCAVVLQETVSPKSYIDIRSGKPLPDQSREKAYLLARKQWIGFCERGGLPGEEVICWELEATFLQ